MLSWLLLSDCRCGSTSIRHRLVALGHDLPNFEALEPAWLDRSLDPWQHLNRTGAHVHRYQVNDLRLWLPLSRLPLRIVSLVRRDTLAQYVSWVNAMRTGLWEGHPRGRPLIGAMDWVECERVRAAWHRQRALARDVFARHPQLEVVYEDYAADPDGTLAAIDRFLK